MIIVNETLFSNLVSGGEPCLITIAGEYGGYVKAGSAYQDVRGNFKVDLMTSDAPTPAVEGVKKEVEHIDTGFDGLVYVDPEVQEGYPQFLNTKDLSLDQLTFLNDNLVFSDGDRLEPRVDNKSMCVLCFFYNDIFVDVEGGKKTKSDLHFNDLFELSE